MIESEQTSVDLEQVLGILRRRAPWILLCIVLAAAAAYGYAKQQTKQYTASAALTFSDNELSKQIAGFSTTVSNAAQEESNLELVRLANTAKTARLIGHGLTAAKVSESLSISGQKESSVVDVSATSTSPRLASEIANTFVSQFVNARQTAERAFFKSALAVVNQQLAQLSPAQRFSTVGVDLEDRAHTLSLLAHLGYSEVQAAGEAVVPSSPSSPKVSRDTALGAFIGLLLGLAVAAMLERFDRRIRKPNELESIYRLPLVGSIPESSLLAKRSGGGKKRPVLPQVEAEAFSLIRAHLRFFNVDRDLRTVLIASPAPDDGKTTIALHLAEAAARSGSRVLLLEVDLRQPTLVQQLDLQPGPGLADVLIGAVSMDEATHSVVLQTALGEGASGRKLDVLAAGAMPPPNPGELLENQTMDTVLERARSAYDLVVIDTPPLTAVSDAFPLLTKVDGVVIVGRIGHSRRDAAEQLHQVLASSGAPLLGVIANEAKSSGPVPYPGSGNSSHIVSANVASSSEELAPTAGS